MLDKNEPFQHVNRNTTIVYIILTIVFVGYYAAFYNAAIYQADIAMEWLWRARATNDLQDMSRYLEKAEVILESYHGNPAFIFPTPDTDYDLIRGNIQETIRTAANVTATQDLSSFAYQQAVQNLQETIVEIAEHMHLANGAYVFNPILNPGFWPLFLVLSFLWVLPTVVAFRRL